MTSINKKNNDIYNGIGFSNDDFLKIENPDEVKKMICNSEKVMIFGFDNCGYTNIKNSFKTQNLSKLCYDYSIGNIKKFSQENIQEPRFKGQSMEFFELPKGKNKLKDICKMAIRNVVMYNYMIYKYSKLKGINLDKDYVHTVFLIDITNNKYCVPNLDIIISKKKQVYTNKYIKYNDCITIKELRVILKYYIQPELEDIIKKTFHFTKVNIEDKDEDEFGNFYKVKLEKIQFLDKIKRNIFISEFIKKRNKNPMNINSLKEADKNYWRNQMSEYMIRVETIVKELYILENNKNSMCKKRNLDPNLDRGAPPKKKRKTNSHQPKTQND